MKTQGRKITILVADDDPIVAFAWQAMLKDTPEYDVTFVEDGEQLVKSAFDKVDIIFTDINMPRLDGVRAARIIRSQCDSVPIIAMTARGDDKTKERCLNVGIDEVQEKPIMLDDIRKIIARLVQ